jgi:hypothetical protein
LCINAELTRDQRKPVSNVLVIPERSIGMRFIKNYLWSFYLGGILAMVHVSFLNWEWWVIVIPTVLFVQMSE